MGNNSRIAVWQKSTDQLKCDKQWERFTRGERFTKYAYMARWYPLTDWLVCKYPLVLCFHQDRSSTLWSDSSTFPWTNGKLKHSILKSAETKHWNTAFASLYPWVLSAFVCRIRGNRERKADENWIFSFNNNISQTFPFKPMSLKREKSL